MTQIKLRYTLRIPKNLSEKLREEAKDRGLTLNALIITKLEGKD